MVYKTTPADHISASKPYLQKNYLVIYYKEIKLKKTEKKNV